MQPIFTGLAVSLLNDDGLTIYIITRRRPENLPAFPPFYLNASKILHKNQRHWSRPTQIP
ncbi:hypothetical protein [Ktedonospora formicarum]|uniref:hypothetical protein n=1 Tax=Ktedonospora formicarum TaxID=2778364 RepID=UPI001C68789C|nr:hypothetical protein [Ktedonospora formicarum]